MKKSLVLHTKINFCEPFHINISFETFKKLKSAITLQFNYLCLSDYKKDNKPFQWLNYGRDKNLTKVFNLI